MIYWYYGILLPLEDNNLSLVVKIHCRLLQKENYVSTSIAFIKRDKKK